MATLRDLIEEQEETNLRLDEIDNRFLEFFAMLRADKLDMLEMMREIKTVATPAPSLAPVPGAAPDAGGPAPTPTLGGLGGLAIGGLVTLPALALGFVEGVFDSIRAIFRAVKIPNLFRPISEMLETKFGRGSRLFTMLDDLVTTTYTYFDDYIVKPFTKFGNFVSEKFTALRNFFDPDGALAKIFRPITDGAEAVGGVFSKIGATFGKFFGAIRAFGAAVGRLFVPLGFILSIVDFVSGMVKGFQEKEGDFGEKVISGAIGGIIGLINGLIMMPLDLIKNGIAFIADKFGFDGFAEKLRSFGFEIDYDPNASATITGRGQRKAAAATAAAATLPADTTGAPTVPGATAVAAEDIGTPIAATPAITPEEVQAQIRRPRTRAAARREQMERNVAEQAASVGNITVINNNTNAPTSVSNQTMMGGDMSLPSPTQSNGTRADAYAGA